MPQPHFWTNEPEHQSFVCGWQSGYLASRAERDAWRTLALSIIGGQIGLTTGRMIADQIKNTFDHMQPPEMT